MGGVCSRSHALTPSTIPEAPDAKPIAHGVGSTASKDCEEPWGNEAANNRGWDGPADGLGKEAVRSSDGNGTEQRVVRRNSDTGGGGGGGAVVYTGGWDKVVREWESSPVTRSESAPQRPVHLPDRGVMGVAVHDGLVASGGADRRLTLARCPGAGQALEHFERRRVGANVRCLSFVGAVLCSGSDDGTVRLWGDVCERARLRHGDFPVRAVAASEVQGKVASGGDDGVIKIWEVLSGREGLHRELHGHTRRVKGLAWAPGNGTLVSCSDDATVRVWEADANLAIGRLGVLRGHTDWVLSVCITTGGSTVASGARDGGLALWDIETLQQLGQPLALPEAVVGVAFRSEHALLACCGSELLVWDVRAPWGLAQAGGFHSPARVTCVAVDGGSGLTVCGDEQGNVHYLWD